MKTVRTDRRDFIRYPTNRVLGTISDAAKAGEAMDALNRAGFDRQHIDLLHGEEDLHRLDPTGEAHGLLGQFQRTLIRSLDLEQFKHLTHYVDDIRAGRFVIMVRTKRRALRILAADILHQHGAEFVGFYGRWACEDLPASPQRSPQDIPGLFVRAWNARDVDALASLFDEDAEFVNASGLVWHDRETIRKGSAEGLERRVAGSMLSTGDTKVKLLSPDVAVVHTRLTLSEQASIDATTPSEPRDTIVSFVVHRIGERWLCASAHNTHVVPVLGTAISHDAGISGTASYPSGHVS